jgi:hypothetical protein
MRTNTAAVGIATCCLLLTGCRTFHRRPGNVPFSADWAEGAFIDCTAGSAAKQNHCTVWKDGTGEILAEGTFGIGSPPRGAEKSELRYVGYGALYHQRGILLAGSKYLSLLKAGERDPSNRLINEKLRALASSGRGEPTDCGSSDMKMPGGEILDCATTSFGHGRPFFVRYSRGSEVPYYSYGMAGDGEGNVFEVIYDMQGSLNLGLTKTAQAFDDNHIRVTTCLKPVAIGKTDEGIVACVWPVNEEASALAARQKPIETTVCAITANPSAFNNKLVRLRGDVSGNFEYSELSAHECSGSIWFAYGNEDGPPGMIAYVSGGAEPGAQDSDGKRILPIPVKLIQDSSFRRFQRLMKARVIADARSEKTNPDELVVHRVTATLTGRIDAVSPDVHTFHLKRGPSGSADFLGFGQMGLFDAQFVLRSVENDAVLSNPPSVPRDQ